MNKARLISYSCLLVAICNGYGEVSEIDKATKGINAITKAFGDSALLFKKTYDQIDPNAVNTNKTIAANNAQVKDKDAKIDAILAGVKQWMITDSNTKQQALQALQQNVDVIDKEVSKAKRQLEIANAAVAKVSQKDKANFTDAIQGAANAVSANTQYYMATKTRLDYEKKYKELLDTRSKRLDMVKRINDPSVIRELLSDNNDLSNKKYATQLSDYVDQDAKLHDKVYRSQSEEQPVKQAQPGQQMPPGQQAQNTLAKEVSQLQTQQSTQQLNQQAPQYANTQVAQNTMPQINPQQLKQQQPQQFNVTENAIWHNVNTSVSTGVKIQAGQTTQLAQFQQIPNAMNGQVSVNPQTSKQSNPTNQTSYIVQKNIVPQQRTNMQPSYVTQKLNDIQVVNKAYNAEGQPNQMNQSATIVNIGDENSQTTTETILKSTEKQQVKITTLNNAVNSTPSTTRNTLNKKISGTPAKFSIPPTLVKKSSNNAISTNQMTSSKSKLKKKLPMPGLLASLPSDSR